MHTFLCPDGVQSHDLNLIEYEDEKGLPKACLSNYPFLHTKLQPFQAFMQYRGKKKKIFTQKKLFRK